MLPLRRHLKFSYSSLKLIQSVNNPFDASFSQWLSQERVNLGGLRGVGEVLCVVSCAAEYERPSCSECTISFLYFQTNCSTVHSRHILIENDDLVLQDFRVEQSVLYHFQRLHTWQCEVRYDRLVCKHAANYLDIHYIIVNDQNRGSFKSLIVLLFLTYILAHFLHILDNLLDSRLRVLNKNRIDA